MEYYIFVSNDCNLNCSYCSIKVDAQKFNLPLEPVYSLETLWLFVERNQIKFKDSEANIIFFGGEPTLNYPYIADCIQYIQKQAKKFTISYMLHTNGLLLKEIPEYILENLNAIMLSVNYLQMPAYNLHQGYFHTLTEGILYIKKKNSQIPIIGRLTITEKSSLFNLVMQLHTFFDYIYWQIENCYSFNDFNCFYDTYEYELNLLMYIWQQYLEKGILLKLIPFISTVTFINEHKIPDSFCCGYNKSMVYIQTNGNCYTCAEDFTTNRNLIGSINTELQFDDFSLLDTKCRQCEYLHICMGRCGRMHKEFTSEHIEEYCKLNQIQFNYFIENIDRINQSASQNNIEINIKNKLFSYTEYTP